MSICPKGGYMKKSKKSNDVDALDVEEKKDAVVDGEKSAEQNPHDEVVANKDVPVSEQTQAEEGKPAAEESPMTEEVPVEAESSQQQEESVAEENKATDAPTENQQPSDESSAQEKSQDEQVTPAEEVVDKKSKKEKKEKKSKKSANEEPKSEDAGVEESEKSEDKKDTSDKKKAGKEKKSKDKSAVKAERKQKVGGYISSLLKYFNIITILPLTCIFYVIFFASDIVDGVAFVQNNKIMVAVMVSILTALLVIWMIDNRNKRRVCSLDAFLLIGLLLSFGMILQCVILGHFKTFDITAILTLITTLLVLVLLTIRLCMFKHEEQAKDDDARYVAKSQLGLYFKVIFSKYALFITTMCMVGVLLILIVTKSEMLEKFEYAATKTEMAVTMIFAAVALVLMVISLFIRIVRGRVNIVDCMPYMFILFAVGTLIYFFTNKIFMILYLSIGSGVVGVIWLCLCQYTFYRKLYDKKFAPAIEYEPVLSIEAPAEDVQPIEEQPIIEEAVVVDEPVVEEPIEEEPPVEEVVEEQPIVEEEPVVEQPVEEEHQPVEETPVEEPAPVEEPVVEEAPAPVEIEEEEEVEEDDDSEEEEEEEEEISVKSIRPRYDYTTKMKLASNDLKTFYSEIKNEFYSYGMKSRISKAKENFTKGREIVARFVINGKTLKLYIALDPATLDQKYFHHKDMSEKKAVAEIPTMLQIRSKQSVSRAKELIAMLAEKIELAKKPRYKEKDFSEDLSSSELTLTQRKGYGYLIKDEIKLEDVEQMPDEFAEVLADVSTDESKSMRFIKTTVTLEEIAEHFEDGDIVTIDTVRESDIGAPNANYLIVEEGQKLNKKLKVYVDEITPNALKMIALAGGEVYKIWRKM